MAVRTAWLIATKDIRQRLRDRSALTVGLMLPLGLAFIFSRILGGVSGGGEIFRYAVVDLDRGAVAHVFAHDVLGAVQHEGFISVRAVSSQSEGRDLTAKGTVAAAFVIPSGFSSAVEANRPASIRVIGNVDSPIGAQVARSIAEGFAANLNAVRLSVATAVAAHTGGVPPVGAPDARAAGCGHGRTGGAPRRDGLDEAARWHDLPGGRDDRRS